MGSSVRTIPQKEITVDFSIENVKSAILKLPKLLDSCKVINEDHVLKIYDLQFTSFMSLGNKLSITLTELSENKTKIIVNTTRMVGVFNEPNEVSSANTDYTKMTQALSKLLSNPNITEDEMKQYSKSKSNANFHIVLFIIFIIAMLYIFLS